MLRLCLLASLAPPPLFARAVPSAVPPWNSWTSKHPKFHEKQQLEWKAGMTGWMKGCYLLFWKKMQLRAVVSFFCKKDKSMDFAWFVLQIFKKNVFFTATAVWPSVCGRFGPMLGAHVGVRGKWEQYGLDRRCQGCSVLFFQRLKAWSKLWVFAVLDFSFGLN